KISHVCHRVVHSGRYDEPVVVNEKSISQMTRLSDLVPLHNGAALSVIKVCTDVLPRAVSVAYFDTIFHRSMPPHISTYPVDQTIAEEHGLRKYGFHSISYPYILNSVSAYLQKPASSLNLILLHLGSGASACAIRNGKSYDTSMSLTPVSGLPGATRSGAIDPSLIFHYDTNKAGKITHYLSLVDVLNKKSGWKAMCGTTDFAEVVDKAELHRPSEEVEGNICRLAFDIFMDRIVGFVGAYFVKLGGEVDALVFFGGIGEKSWHLRKAVGKRAQCLGF
ncbi:putative acetate kinase, partial [Leucoagaricus sp. SymC.cos]